MYVSQSLVRLLILRGLAWLHDFFVAALAFGFSLLIRLGSDELLVQWQDYLQASLVFALLVGSLGIAFGMNRGVWRYASIPDLVAIVKTVTLAILLFVAAHFILTRLAFIPRSTVFVTWAFTIVLLTAPRAAYRLYRDNRDARRNAGSATSVPKRVLLVGANHTADNFLKALNEHFDSRYEVLAIVDERERRIGRIIRGVPVIGGIDKLAEHVKRFEAREQRPEALILTRSREEYQKHANLADLVKIASELNLELLRAPNPVEMQAIDAELNVRPIKLEDLLPRPAIRHDIMDIAEMIRGHRVLITGAGGSIGSELARQVLTLSPSSLTLVDSSEFLLYTIESEILRSAPTVPISAVLGDVRNRKNILRLLEAERPEIVLHAAALKHVPIVENQPLEGILTNSIGTRNIADACLATKVKAMIMISTDKAVNPANVMGASKRMAEMYCQALDIHSGAEGTRFVTVRFGNVLGSAGSVVPLFEKQIKAGGPLTVTHPEIERYFMTIPEACLLVLQAAAHALHRETERGRIFVLDMGSPVKIVDLARNLIRLSGMRPDVDIRIVYTGLRPGEKLYEELFASRETLVETGVASIMAAFPRPTDRALMIRIFDEMDRLIGNHETASVLRLLCSAIPEFVAGPSIQALLSGTNTDRPATGPGASLPSPLRNNQSLLPDN